MTGADLDLRELAGVRGYWHRYFGCNQIIGGSGLWRFGLMNVPVGTSGFRDLVNEVCCNCQQPSTTLAA